MKNERTSAVPMWGVLLGNALPLGPSKFSEVPATMQTISLPQMPVAWEDVEERHLSVEAHVRESIAWQVRINREERGLTQKQLAELVNTGQSAISKIEDPDGGDVRLSSLVKLARGFDCALQVRFVSFSEFWAFTGAPRSEKLLAASYGAESAPLVRHVADQAQTVGIE